MKSFTVLLTNLLFTIQVQFHERPVHGKIDMEKIGERYVVVFSRTSHFRT